MTKATQGAAFTSTELITLVGELQFVVGLSGAEMHRSSVWSDPTRDRDCITVAIDHKCVLGSNSFRPVDDGVFNSATCVSFTSSKGLLSVQDALLGRLQVLLDVHSAGTTPTLDVRDRNRCPESGGKKAEDGGEESNGSCVLHCVVGRVKSVGLGEEVNV